MPWTNDDELKLLMAIIATNNKTPNWDEVALMIGKTKEASRQHYQKLRRDSVVEGGHDGDYNNKTPPKTLSRKDGHSIKSESGGERAATSNGKPANKSVSQLAPNSGNNRTPEPATKTLPRKRGIAEVVNKRSSSTKLARMTLTEDEDYIDDSEKTPKSDESIASAPSTPRSLPRKRDIAKVVRKPSAPSKRARMVLAAVEGEDHGGPGAGLTRSGRPSRSAPKPSGALLLRDEFFDREIVQGEDDE